MAEDTSAAPSPPPAGAGTSRKGEENAGQPLESATATTAQPTGTSQSTPAATNNDLGTDTAAATSTGPSSGTAIATTTMDDAVPVPLDSPLRTTPIHPSIPAVKVPESATTTDPNTHPVTLRPFTDADLEKYGYEKLREQILRVGAGNATGGAAGAGSEKERQKRGNGGTAGVGVSGGIGGAAAGSSEKEKEKEKPKRESGRAGAGSGASGGAVKPGTGAGMTEKRKREIERIKDETAALLKQKLEERETKVRQIEREKEDMEKTREVERKVFQKKFGAGKEG